jgi:hypothetical protein
MAQRAQTALAAAIVVASALAGLVGLPFWAFLVAGLGLSIISVSEQQKLWPRFAAIGSTNMLTMAHLAALADSCLVSAAAWGAGFLLRHLLASA